MATGIMYDYRATYLKPIFFRLSFRDVVLDETLNIYVPGNEYTEDYLVSNPFEIKVTFHEISSQNPYGNYLPFLTMKANEQDNVVVLNSNEVKKLRMVASAEWKKPGDKFLSVWSTSHTLDLTKGKDFTFSMVLDQVSIGREPLMANIMFNPIVDSALSIDRKIGLYLELIRTDVGAFVLPGSFKVSHKINVDETLVLELPRGQWFYTVRSMETA